MSANQSSSTSQSITLLQAIEMTKRYRDQYQTILDAQYRGSNVLPLSETFDKEVIDSFFNNPACSAVRVYYGMSENLNVHAILVGVNSDNEDLLPAVDIEVQHSNDANNNDDGDNEIFEDAVRCPPICPPGSPLNEP